MWQCSLRTASLGSGRDVKSFALESPNIQTAVLVENLSLPSAILDVEPVTV